MRRGKWGLREQTEIVDNEEKSVQNSIFPKKGKKWVCKTYPQNWGQNVDNVDNKKVEHIFCATCLVYHKVGGLAEEKTFYLDRQGGGVLQQVIANAFHVKDEDMENVSGQTGIVKLPGVVSRKKQLAPQIMMALQ